MGNLTFTQSTLLLHAGATLAMVGLIWFVQIVHYPLMGRVPSEAFPQYEEEHQRLTSLVVIPLMLTELATAVILVWSRPSEISPATVWISLALLLTIWLVTFTIQVPQHASLTASFDPLVHRRLVQGNWIRTLAWSARGVLALWMIRWQ